MHEEGKTMSLDTSSITNQAHRTVFAPNLGQKSKEQNRSVFIWFGAAIYISLLKAHECWKDAGTGGGQGSFLAKHYFISSAFLRHHTKTAQSQGVMIWYDMRVPCQHCQIRNTLVAVWKSALSAKQQREKSRAMVVHCLQPDAMGCEPPSSSTWNTHSYGPLHTHQPYAAKRGIPGFLPQRAMQLEVITGLLLVQSVATGKPLSYSSPPCSPHMTAWLLINSNGVCEQGWWSDLDLSQADLPCLTTSRASAAKLR